MVNNCTCLSIWRCLKNVFECMANDSKQIQTASFQHIGSDLIPSGPCSANTSGSVSRVKECAICAILKRACRSHPGVVRVQTVPICFNIFERRSFLLRLAPVRLDRDALMGLSQCQWNADHESRIESSRRCTKCSVVVFQWMLLPGATAIERLGKVDWLQYVAVQFLHPEQYFIQLGRRS